MAEDGSLRGLVDWDGVAAIPRCVGNRRYPDWIIRDWNPELYSYDPEQDDVEQREDSPEALTRYREIFARAMDQTLSECDLSQNITHNSLILENIRLAVDQPFYMTSIVDKIYKEITRIIAPESLEEALTESDEGDKAEAGSGIDSEGEEPTIEGGAFVDTDTDSKQGDGALTANAESVSTDEDGKSDEASDLYVYETALALAKDCLDEKRLGMLKDGFLRLFA